MFKFHFRAVEVDPTGYYYAKWNEAIGMTIKAENQEEAESKAKSALGDGKKWPYQFKLDRVESA